MNRKRNRHACQAHLFDIVSRVSHCFDEGDKDEALATIEEAYSAPVAGQLSPIDTLADVMMRNGDDELVGPMRRLFASIEWTIKNDKPFWDSPIRICTQVCSWSEVFTQDYLSCDDDDHRNVAKLSKGAMIFLDDIGVDAMPSHEVKRVDRTAGNEETRTVELTRYLASLKAWEVEAISLHADQLKTNARASYARDFENMRPHLKRFAREKKDLEDLWRRVAKHFKEMYGMDSSEFADFIRQNSVTKSSR